MHSVRLTTSYGIAVIDTPLVPSVAFHTYNRSPYAAYTKSVCGCVVTLTLKTNSEMYYMECHMKEYNRIDDDNVPPSDLTTSASSTPSTYREE